MACRCCGSDTFKGYCTIRKEQDRYPCNSIESIGNMANHSGYSHGNILDVVLGHFGVCWWLNRDTLTLLTPAAHFRYQPVPPRPHLAEQMNRPQQRDQHTSGRYNKSNKERECPQMQMATTAASTIRMRTGNNKAHWHDRIHTPYLCDEACASGFASLCVRFVTGFTRTYAS